MLFNCPSFQCFGALALLWIGGMAIACGGSSGPHKEKQAAYPGQGEVQAALPQKMIAASAAPKREELEEAARTRPKNSRVGAGSFHSCAIGQGGRLYCWGHNTKGQLGDGGTRDRGIPALVPGLSQVIEVGTGEWFTCALDVQGAVYCWGENTAGQLGDGSFSERHTPGRPLAMESARQIAVGLRHACALLQNGKLYCWGHHEMIQTQTTAWAAPEYATPRAIPLPPGRVIEVRAGARSTCAIFEDHRAHCWGVQDAQNIQLTQPFSATTLPFQDIAGVAMGSGMHQCVWLMDGSLHCWGSHSFGELGIEGYVFPHAQMEPVLNPNMPAVIQAGVGYGHTCALTLSKEVFCWGNSIYGKTGPSEQSPKHLPVRIPKLENIEEISVGSTHNCAGAQEGRVFCWGGNNFGELGDGTTTHTPIPVEHRLE